MRSYDTVKQLLSTQERNIVTDELEFDEQLRTLPDLITNEERKMVRETEEPLREKFLENFRLITEEWCNKRKINLHLGSFRLCDGPSYYQCKTCGTTD